MSLWLLVVVVIGGAVGQFIDAVGGMGFGAFSSTVLIAAGVPPAVAVLTVNLAKIGSGLLSGGAHWRFGNVRWGWVVPLLAPGLVGAVFGALLLTGLPEEVARLWVPGVLLAMGMLILFRFLSVRPDVTPAAGASQDWVSDVPQGFWATSWRALADAFSHVSLMVIGFLAGTLNAVSGAFGPFATPSVILAKGGHPRYAVGTVNFVEFFVASTVSATLLLRLDWGAFHWQLPLALMVGGVVTAPFGAYLSRRLPLRVHGAVVGVLLIGINLTSILRAIV